jgi:hypothetical protein
MVHFGLPNAVPYTTVLMNDTAEHLSAVVTEALAVETNHVREVSLVPHASHAHQ